MRRNKIPILIFTIICLIFSAFSFSEAINTPTEDIKTTINSIIDVLKDKELSLSARTAERRSKIRALINERFDFKEMAKRSLGRHWNKRTPEEKKEFVSIFSDLLEASYIGKILAYTDEKIIYKKESIKGNGRYAVVNTTVMTEKVDIPIDYKVIFRGNGWMVYDVLIEGVSFISTYRSQYNQILKKESYAKLIQIMKNKLDKLDDPSE